MICNTLWKVKFLLQKNNQIQLFNTFLLNRAKHVPFHGLFNLDFFNISLQHGKAITKKFRNYSDKLFYFLPTVWKLQFQKDWKICFYVRFQRPQY